MENINLLKSFIREHSEDRSTIKKALSKVSEIQTANLDEASINLDDDIIFTFEKYIIKIIYNPEDEYYKVDKIFNDYTSSTYYDIEWNSFRKTTLFNIPNSPKVFGIDRTIDDEQGFRSDRFLIGNKESTYGLDEFEYSILYITDYDSKEKFIYYDKEEKKYLHRFLELEDLIIYSHKENYISPTTMTKGEIEIDFKTTPYDNEIFTRRNKYTTEYDNVLKQNYSNMVITGYELNESNNELNTYEIRLKKMDDIIYVGFNVRDKDNKEIINEIFAIVSETYEDISIEDINALIPHINRIITLPCSNIIKLQIKRLIYEYKEYMNGLNPNPTLFDYKLIEHKDFNHLAFDIYSNFDKYLEYINSLYDKEKKILFKK